MIGTGAPVEKALDADHPPAHVKGLPTEVTAIDPDANADDQLPAMTAATGTAVTAVTEIAIHTVKTKDGHLEDTAMHAPAPAPHDHLAAHPRAH